MRAQLAEFQAERDARAAELARAQTAELVRKGQAEALKDYYEKEIKERETRFNALMDQTRNAERSRSIMSALSAFQFAHPEVSNDLISLWANDFEVIDAPGSPSGFTVRDKVSLRPVDQVVAERLSQPRYAIYLAPKSRGGGGSGAGGASMGSPQMQQPPRSYEQRVMDEWNSRQRQAEDGPSWMKPWRPQRASSNN